MRVSVIVTTYNQPAQLEKVLWGYAGQRGEPFELIVADDGSGPESAEVIDRIGLQTGVNMLHVWHEDRGFRKTAILNRAIVASRGDYLIFSDGDCIPRDDFVATHVRLARAESFLSGGYIKLSADVSRRVDIADIRSGRVMDASHLRSIGWKPGKRALRLLRGSVRPSLLDAVTPTNRSWNGHNSSATRRAILDANGFDMDMGYGGEDRALGERLQNAGIHGRQVRHRIPCLHLFHERPYVDPVRWQLNHDIRTRIRENGETRAKVGIAELSVAEGGFVRRPGESIASESPRQAVAAQ